MENPLHSIAYTHFVHRLLGSFQPYIFLIRKSVLSPGYMSVQRAHKTPRSLNSALPCVYLACLQCNALHFPLHLHRAMVQSTEHTPIRRARVSCKACMPDG